MPINLQHSFLKEKKERKRRMRKRKEEKKRIETKRGGTGRKAGKQEGRVEGKLRKMENESSHVIVCLRQFSIIR